MSEHIARQSDQLLGRLKQLQTRYPALIRDARVDGTLVDLEFYLPDVAIDTTAILLDAGITAIHRIDRPQIMSLQLSSLLAQHQILLTIQTLDTFLQQHAPGTDRPARMP